MNGGRVPAAAEDVTGEVRSALAPSKPQRTASMRDQAVAQPVPRRTHSDNITSATQEVNQHRNYDVGLAAVRSTSDSPVRDPPVRFIKISLNVYRMCIDDLFNSKISGQFAVDFSIIFSSYILTN